MKKKRKDLDIQLSDPIKYKEITKEKDFFKNYDSEAQKIIKMENDWEVLVTRLNALKKDRNL